MVKICNISYAARHARDENTAAFAIVRSMTRPVDGVVQLPVLSPSRELFLDYRRWAADGSWNATKFADSYVPRFLSQIRNDRDAHLALKDIWERDHADGNILLACFCPDERMCHRSIVAGLLSGIGAKVITDTGDDYIKYYRQYRKLPVPAFAGRDA